ncbi:phosphate/phosphite/phosphonate ABC transporter substrate-binding protein [Haloplanus halophilus]|uniref:phosphate/phosphite/phosphonate ABC transporter substrate-binding protein n=1 Tax=Haloplanus halophilus TaxID=2949993 RepID=UPI00203CE168|nr:PhnD/SsuA/transferrin family substrate-binding protein [Haloplanus sp. GDY1]
MTAGIAGCSGGSGGGSGDGSGGESGDGSDGGSEDGSGSTVGSSGDDYEPITFLETPAETPGDTEEMWEPFTEYLQSEVDGLELDVQFADNTSAIGQALINNQAEMTRSDIVLLANPDQIDVVGIVKEGGASVYFSALATLPDSDIEETTDIEGTSIAFADRPSTSGSLYPNYMLHKAGLDTGEAPYGDPVGYDGNWTGSHRNAVQTLINREDIVACGCDIAVLLNHIPEDQWPERVRERSGRWDDDVGTESPELELVEASTSLPFSPIITRSNWEHPLRSQVEEAIVSIDSGTLREPDGDVENPLSAVSAATIEDYQPVINVIEALDVDLGQL